jgi:hypothetical protein
MSPVEVEDFLARGIVQRDSLGLSFRVRPGWPVEGETRLGYTQIVRLIECARQLHWSVLRTKLPGMDSTLSAIDIRFLYPLTIGDHCLMRWKVGEENSHGYCLTIDVTIHARSDPCLVARLTSRYLSADGTPATIEKL